MVETKSNLGVPRTDPEPIGDRPADGLRMLVAIPALNEERTVADVIGAIPERMDGIETTEVLVVDDGSTDRTADLARQAGAHVISHGSTRGVGGAFHTALAYAMDRPYDLLVTLDADGQFDPKSIPDLIRPVVDGAADFATASRFKDPSLTPEMPRVKKWGNRMMARLISRIARQRLFDVSCGMRCYGRTAAMHLNLMGSFTYTQEVFLNLAFKGLRIAEVPIPVRGQREFGESRVAGNLWRYAWRTQDIIFRCYRDYRPLRFFGRLSLMLMIPGVALAVWFLVHYLMTGRFTGQKWSAFTGAALFVFGLILLLVGILGDMLNRHRIYLEELLFFVRQQKRNNGDRDSR